METIKLTPINSMKPDPTQPRKYIDEERVREIAQSILTEGIINPIEIDETNTIVTGEMRWRGARHAGLEKVPTRLLSVEGRERFRRQVIENVHHNTMAAMDTAESFQKLLDWTPYRESQHGQPREITTGKFTGDEQVKRLAEEIGKSTDYIYLHLSLLKEDDEVKDWLRTPEGKYTLITEANKAPEQYRKQIKQKVMNKEITHAHVVRELAKAIKRAPDKADKLLKVNMQDGGITTINHRLRTIAPEDNRVNAGKKGDRLVDAILHLRGILATTRREDLVGIDAGLAMKQAMGLRAELDKFINDEGIIEGQLVN